MAFLYIFLSVCLGAGIILSLKPYWQSSIKILNESNIITPAFLLLPSSYLIGTLVLSWLTYFLAVVFKGFEKPLIYADIISCLLSISFLIFITFINRKSVKKLLYEVRKYGFRLDLKKTEWFIVISSTLFWTFFICRSFSMNGNNLHAGISAFSDFGAHLPVIRSFSAGKNFPAQYPHFPDGTIRYHFMFYFMAANLEFLGLSLPQALNIPSILSLVSFSMLLYALAVFITKKPLAGILSCFLFAFRSSFAFFTYLDGFTSIKNFIYAVANNLNSDGSHREHIGNTLHEDWGLWAQKVYINQRHLAYAMALYIIVLFLMLPIFIETVEHIRKALKTRTARNPVTAPKENFIARYFGLVLFSGEAWSIRFLIPCILSGLILGLTAYWNGAVVIAGISILFIMAALSMHKLGYLVTAVITFILSFFQSRVFSGNGTGVVSLKYNPGFLAESKSLKHILAYYTELLGILPFVLSGLFIFHMARKNKIAGLFLSAVSLILMFVFMPSIGGFWAFIIIIIIIAFFMNLVFCDNTGIKPVSAWFIPVFTAPIILATTLQLTPDVTVNHKYIILAVILLNIPVSDLLTELFKTKPAMAVSICILLLLTCTGFVDMMTLYNLDKNSVSYNQKDPVLIWVKNETEPDDVFLTHYMTHYGAPMSIMLAGRSVYNGYPYFTITAGYDISKRENIMKSIYSATDSGDLRSLALSEGIDFIVIEEQNRNAEEYILNEEIFYETFDVAFQNNSITIFRVR